ncbi:hypothetical protein MPTK1_4g11880 [Marchantia polymorpha subsp. ruderalis]|nr:hypothetical protein MARPO_0011s0173 [Marchantia polymorpha]BBN08476.1 hypothetical protein Mp_4g11880 [Marchantia polymorpha subsp. ruderalis]|eukprot:PTQ46513.1 hypothetical protein MARPO_0011s0173 [Marchantia polymorpha]
MASQSRSEPDFGNNVEDDESGDEYDDEDNSGQVMFEENVEIIMRAAMNLFRKYSSKGIRAIREISPPAISTELIAFGVKGTLCVAFLWVFRAILEIFCSMATYVFAGLLVLRLAWSVVASSQPRDPSWSADGN